MAPAIRFSLRLNNDRPAAEYVSLAVAAERAGFHQFWVSNDLFFRSAPAILTAVAAATHVIEIGTSILNPHTIHPSEMAMLAATLDELSDCRFNLGIASGASDFLSWIGIARERPLTIMRETVTAVRDLLAGDAAAIEGHFLNWTDKAYLRFPAPRITPIYLGAMGPGMLRLAGELADGALPLLFPPEHYFRVLPYVEEGMRARGKRLPPLDLALCIWVSLSADREKARRALAEKIAYYGASIGPLILEQLGLTREDFLPLEHAAMVEKDLEKAASLVTDAMLQIGVVGHAEDVLQRLTPLVASGARHLSFGPPLGPDPLLAVELLGEKVLPHFR